MGPGPFEYMAIYRPKDGAYTGQIRQRNRRCFDILHLLWSCLVLWFSIVLKWRIKAWGWIPILLWTFLELSKFRPNLDPWTPYVLPKYPQ